MDVHRCRFVPYPAAEINALAFSHQSNPNEKSPQQLRLAIGRSNGDIEIWNPLGGTWAQETVLRSGAGRTVEGLAWTQDPLTVAAEGKKIPGKLRLFSIGNSPYVTEWDLSTGLPARFTSSSRGDVQCIAAQPLSVSKISKKARKEKASLGLAADSSSRRTQLLALGCSDGSIVILSTADDELTYVKTIPQTSGRKSCVMTVTWKGNEEVLAGYADSMIRVYDVNVRAQQIAAMSLGSTGRNDSSKSLVWNLKVLRDHTIVSADSSGEIKIWDAENFTLLQRIKGHLDTEVLCLATNYDGSMILSGGMDRRTVLYQPVTNETNTIRRWAQVAHQRFHVNDVKVMATFESSDISVVVSGGQDATPIINPLKTFGQEYHRALPSLACTPVVRSSPGSRLMISWWRNEVNIWRIPPRNLVEDSEDDRSDDKLVARIMLKGEDWIKSAAINSSGDAIVVATNAAMKVFHLRPSKTSQMLRVQKVDIPGTGASAGRKLVDFSPDGKWLVSVLSNNAIELMRFLREAESRQVYRVLTERPLFERHHTRPKERVDKGTHGNYDRVVTRLAWSEDSRILAAGDISGRIDIFVLEGEEDPDWTGQANTNGVAKTPKASDSDEESSDDEDDEDHPQIILGQHWKKHSERLPVLPSAPMVMSFRPSRTHPEPSVNGNVGLHPTRHNPVPHSHALPHGEDRLVIVTAQHDFLEFHALTGKLSDWSKRNPTSAMPLEFRNVQDRAMDCLWDAANNRQRVFVHGSTWIWMFNLSRDMPDPSSLDGTDGGSQELVVNSSTGLKRKRELTQKEKRALIKKSAGAGCEIRPWERLSGAGARLRVQAGDGEGGQTLEYTYDQSYERKRVTESGSETDDDDPVDDLTGIEDALESGSEEEEDEEETSLALARKRRSERTDSEVKGDGRFDSVRREPPHEWHTYKYRSILGVVALKSAASEENEKAVVAQNGSGSQAQAFEVAIVERPIWEADLKDRWEGPQEWGER